MSESALTFRDISKVRSVVNTYYKVRKKKGLFSRRTCFEEVRASSEKVIFDNGKIVKREMFSFREDGTYRILYEYSNGLETRCRTINPAGHVVEEKRTEYLPNNTRKYMEFKNGKLETECIYVYDLYDHIIESRYTVRFGEKSMEFFQDKWEYGESEYGGRYEINYDYTNIRKQTETHYDNAGRIKKEIEYDSDGQMISTIEYSYDSKGRECERILDGVCVEEERYNEHGDSVWMKWYPNYYKGWWGTGRKNTSPDKYKEAITTMKYRYDEYDNWIELRQYRDGEYNLLHTREIEYY